jgi:hypothetical protein
LPKRNPDDEFFDMNKKADIPNGEVFHKDSKRVIKDMATGKDILNSTYITEDHFKKD